MWSLKMSNFICLFLKWGSMQVKFMQWVGTKTGQYFALPFLQCETGGACFMLFIQMVLLLMETTLHVSEKETECVPGIFSPSACNCFQVAWDFIVVPSRFDQLLICNRWFSNFKVQDVLSCTWGLLRLLVRMKKHSVLTQSCVVDRSLRFSILPIYQMKDRMTAGWLPGCCSNSL